jgi:monovalent cation/proton antiporter MnhG/PhaG subunit
MNAHDLAIDILLALGVGAELVCCLGLVAARDALDRLHYSAASTTVGPVLIGVAILLEESFSSAGIATLTTVAFLFVLNPALTIATARAARPRYRDRQLTLAEAEEDAA